jgi:hypothetical protein
MVLRASAIAASSSRQWHPLPSFQISSSRSSQFLSKLPGDQARNRLGLRCFANALGVEKFSEGRAPMGVLFGHAIISFSPGRSDRDPPWQQQKPVIGRIAALRREDGELGECLEVTGVKCVNAADVVRLHGGDDLQIEHVAAGHRVA